MSLFSTEQQLLAVHQVNSVDGRLTSELASLSEPSAPAEELAFSTFAAAADESTGRLYYVESGVNGRIAYWDAQSQTNVILTDAAGQELRTGSTQEWLKLDRVGSVFYAMDGVTSTLYRFDPQTQALDQVGSIEGLTPGSGDIAASPSNPNQLFVLSSGSDFYKLYLVDLTTQKSTLLDDLPFKPQPGQEFSGALESFDGKLYANFNQDGQSTVYELELTEAGVTPIDVGVFPDVINDFTTVLPLPAQPGVEESDSGVTSPVDTSGLSQPSTAIKGAEPEEDCGCGEMNRMNGTREADRLTGEAQPNRIRGYAGRDLLVGRMCDDRLDGGQHSDRLLGNFGSDRLWGRRGADALVGGGGPDRVRGGRQSDLLRGQQGRDRLRGQQGRDRVVGGDGRDVLRGGKGRDTLLGNHGTDVLVGGLGADRLYGGVGKDQLTGGAGKDVFFLPWQAQAEDRITDFDPTSDRVKFTDELPSSLSRSTNLLSQIQLETVGSATNVYALPDAISGLRLLAVLDGVGADQLSAQNFAISKS